MRQQCYSRQSLEITRLVCLSQQQVQVMLASEDRTGFVALGVPTGLETMESKSRKFVKNQCKSGMSEVIEEAICEICASGDCPTPDCGSTAIRRYFVTKEAHCTGGVRERVVVLLMSEAQAAKGGDLCWFGLGVAGAGVEQVQDSLLDALGLV